MTTGCLGHTATLLDSGQVLATGGYHFDALRESASGPRGAAYLYDPAAKSFTPVSPMAKARMGHMALRLYSGHVLLFGGTADDNDASYWSVPGSG
ncbi:hypothetical protein [Melittangium boletus]|uniref:hypothetical protein n=1 Tax=Melittangium boletus TaxID=83453 RepID=UPI000BB37ECF|nr:hypothetical protein [Melittangium boletus]